MSLSEKPAVRALKRLMGWILTVVLRVVLSAMFLSLALPYAVDKIALGPDFNIAIVVAATVAFCAILLLNVFWGRVWSWFERQINRLRMLRLSPRVRRVMSSLGLLGIVAFSLVILIQFYSHQSRTVADAEAALRNFQVRAAPGLDKANFNQTLAEFERARRSLEKVWPKPADSSHITLRLFGSIEEYHAVTGRNNSAGAASCPPTGATVWVPLEQAIELPGEDDDTLTPLHEMVHAMMCQYLGQEAFYSIPRWFHEGMAELYQNEAPHLWTSRATNRLYVWFHSDKLMASESFCTEPFMQPKSEFGLFYMTVLEFARSLESEHGRTSLLAVVDDVQGGMRFEDSLQDHFGSACVELYGNWLASW